MDKSVPHYIILTCIGNDVIFFFFATLISLFSIIATFLSPIIADFIADFIVDFIVDFYQRQNKYITVGH